ncbi:hypothetical protein ACHAWF_010772 [Thalassiosira exigua]
MANEVPLADAEDEINPEVIDQYIGAKVVLNESANGGGNIVTVKRRATNIDGRPLGTSHRNQMLDTRECEVDLEDGMSGKLLANSIDTNIYSQIDDEWHEVLAFSDIVDHRRSEAAFTKENGFDKMKNGKKKCKNTTKGRQLMAE